MPRQGHLKNTKPKTKVGLIVNPVAGMGGSVGLKGTDGPMRQRAVRPEERGGRGKDG